MEACTKVTSGGDVPALAWHDKWPYQSTNVKEPQSNLAHGS